MKLVLGSFLLLSMAAGAWMVYQRTGTPVVATPTTQPAPAKPVSMSDWPKEKMVEQPVAYLEFFETQIDETIAKLNTAQADIETLRASYTRMRDREAAALREANDVAKQLGDLVTAGAWPARWSGEERSERWVKAMLADLHDRAEARRNLVATYETHLAGLQKRLAQIPRDLDAAALRKAEVRAARDECRLGQMSDETAKRLMEMRPKVEEILKSGRTQ